MKYNKYLKSITRISSITLVLIINLLVVFSSTTPAAVQASQIPDIRSNADVSFFTPPSIITNAATSITSCQAVLNMAFNFADALSGLLQFGYRVQGAFTWTYSTWLSQSGSGPFTLTLGNLTPGTTYEFVARLSYTNIVPINIEGGVLTFTTLPFSTVIANAPINITPNSSTVNLAFDFKNNPIGLVQFAYKPQIASNWLYTNWVVPSEINSYSTTLVNLLICTLYEFKARLQYCYGEIESPALTFRTLCISNAPVSTLPIESSSPSLPPEKFSKPANISVTQLNVQPQNAAVGQSVIVFANMVNRGDEDGVYKATLKINGNVQDIKNGNISGNKAVPLQYTITRDKPGNYEVDLNGQKTSFMITEPVTSNAIDARTIIALLLGLLLLATLVILIRHYVLR